VRRTFDEIHVDDARTSRHGNNQNFLAGFWVVDVEGAERAYAIAGKPRRTARPAPEDGAPPRELIVGDDARMDGDVVEYLAARPASGEINAGRARAGRKSESPHGATSGLRDSTHEG
jgi:hypothetical protein